MTPESLPLHNIDGHLLAYQGGVGRQQQQQEQRVMNHQTKIACDFTALRLVRNIFLLIYHSFDVLFGDGLTELVT